MKSTEFLKEWAPSQKEQRNDAEDAWEQIKKNIVQIGKECKPYLSQVQDPFGLYRGVAGGAGLVIKKRVRLDDRQPLGMEKRMQVMVNKFFTKKFGAPFRFSMLCTGEQWVAKQFGEVYIIFPIGDFEILWANDVEDLNEHIWHFEESFGDKIEYSDIVQFLGDKDYRTNDIKSAIASGKEIMIRTKGYYGLNLDDLRGQGKDEVQSLLEKGMEL